MSKQRQHILLSYFNTLSVCPGRVWALDLLLGNLVLITDRVVVTCILPCGPGTTPGIEAMWVQFVISSPSSGRFFNPEWWREKQSVLVPCKNRFNELNMKLINETRTSEEKKYLLFFFTAERKKDGTSRLQDEESNCCVIWFQIGPFQRRHKGGTNTAIPHVVAREYHNTTSRFTQIPKQQVQIRNSCHCQY